MCLNNMNANKPRRKVSSYQVKPPYIKGPNALVPIRALRKYLLERIEFLPTSAPTKREVKVTLNNPTIRMGERLYFVL
jgi:hypothetical protein